MMAHQSEAPTHLVRPEEMLTNKEILGEKLNLSEITQALSSSDQIDLLRWCAKRKLIRNSMPHTAEVDPTGGCGSLCRLVRLKAGNQDGYQWTCSACNFSTTVRNKSVFGESFLLPMRNIVVLAYCWAQGYSLHQAKKECKGGCALESARRWFRVFRGVCFELNTRNLDKIGGRDGDKQRTVVEFGRHLLPRKVGEGKKGIRDWLFLGVERKTGRIFLSRQECGGEQAVKAVLDKFVAPGTKIIVDGDFCENSELAPEDCEVQSFKGSSAGSDDPSLHANAHRAQWARIRRRISAKKRSLLKPLLEQIMFFNRSTIRGQGKFEALLLAFTVRKCIVPCLGIFLLLFI